MLANGFAAFALARYCNLQRLSTPMEPKQGMLLDSVITCTGNPADTWSFCELWPIPWRLENTVEASSPMFHNRPVNDQSMTRRPYHTGTAQPSHRGDRTVCRDATIIRHTRQPVRRTCIT
jgi:hypothetical protein